MKKRNIITLKILVPILFIFILGCADKVNSIVYPPIIEASDAFNMGFKGDVKSIEYKLYFGKNKDSNIIKGDLKHSYTIYIFNQKGNIMEQTRYDSNNNVLNRLETVYDTLGFKIKTVSKMKSNSDSLIEVENYYYNKDKGWIDSIIKFNTFINKKDYKIILNHNSNGQKIKEEWISQVNEYPSYSISYKYNTDGELEKEKVITNNVDSTIRYYKNGILKDQLYYEGGRETVIFGFKYSDFDSKGNWTKQIRSVEYVDENQTFYDVIELKIEYW